MKFGADIQALKKYVVISSFNGVDTEPVDVNT